MADEVPLAEALAGYVSEDRASIDEGVGADRSALRDSSQRPAPTPQLAAEPDSPPPVRARVAKITPKLARGLLDQRNDHNRDVVRSRVDQYIADILRGDWKVNGEAIKIDWNGQVLDGQHRLYAVVESGTAILSVIVTGLDPVAQESMDQGLPRGFHDVLHLRGERNPYELAAATKMVATYERDGCPFARGYRAAISNQTAAHTLERNPELRESVIFACGLRKRIGKMMPASNIAALHFLMCAVDEQRATSFFEELANGVLDTRPVQVLRTRLVNEALDLDAPRAHAKIRMVYAVIAWNATIRERYLDDSELRWAMRDPFPGIHGLTHAGD